LADPKDRFANWKQKIAHALVSHTEEK